MAEQGAETLGRILSYKHGEGSVKNVDPRLWDIVQNAIAATPYDAEIRSGAEQRSTRGNNHNHGWAVDVTLIDPQTGRKLPDYQDGTAFSAYEQYAQAARVYQQQKYPELDNTFRWGGYFGSKSGLKGYGAADLMHLDINPNMNGAMSQGSWEKGAGPALLKAYPGAKTNGGLGGAEGARRVAQYRSALEGSGGLTPPGIIPGPAPVPGTMSDRVRMARLGADDTGIGTAFSQLERFGQPGAVPATMSDELAYSSGRVRDVPLPRSRPVGPVADVAMPRARPEPPTRQASIGPIGAMGTPGYPPASSPLESARAKLTAALQNGVTGSPIANVPAPNVDMARMSAETGRDIGRDGVTFDRTYDAGNRMSTPGLGSLLDSRSFSPATQNPAQRAAAPTGPSNRGRPVSSAAPAPTGPANRGRPVLSSAPSTPSGPANRGRPTSSASSASRPIGPIGMTGTPGFAPSASPTNRTSPAQKTANGISGTAQMPLNARPSSPAVPKEPAYIVKKIQVLNPEWKEPVATDPLALERMEKAQTLNRYKPAPTVPKYITKTVTVPNPSYVAPRPQAMPPALAASRMAVGQQPNALRAPVPATQSAALRSQRAATPPSSAREYEAANRAAKQRAIANSSNPSKTAARASLAAQWGFD